MSAPPAVIEVADALSRHGYLADEGLATAVFLALRLRRPLLLEGEAGVGKTEVAKVLSRWTGGELIRLQCYEGIDVAQAVYEWDYSRQLLHLRAAEASGEAAGAGTEALEDELYAERFLVKRPLLRAIAPSDGPSPGPADRRGRPGRRRVRGVPARDPVRLPDHRARAGHVPRRAAADRGHHLEPHARRARRAQAPLPLPLGRAPDFEREVAIVRLRAPEVQRGPGPSGGGRGRGAARPGAVQAAGRGRDDRLGRGARRARHDRARRGDGRPPRSARC